jgi:leader peptidase (prepilin peptidase)/N-methyltransferase
MSEAVLLVAVPAGAAAGSFGCLVARRIARGEDWVAAPSRCEACGTRLGWRETVPVLSWLARRGRCRHCGAAIPADHLPAELAGAALPIWAWLALPQPLFWPGALFGWLLLLLSLIDVATLRLPRPPTLALLVLGLAVAAAIDRDLVVPHLLAALAGWGLFEAIAWAHLRLRGREGLGRGDALLLGAAGAWVGPQGLPSVVLAAALAGLGWAALTRAGPGRRLPFGPFLALGAWVTWLHGPILWG